MIRKSQPLGNINIHAILTSVSENLILLTVCAGEEVWDAGLASEFFMLKTHFYTAVK